MLDDDLRTWWGKRSAQQRGVLGEAAGEFRMDADVLDLLRETGCPVQPAEGDPGRRARPPLWPDYLRRFVLEQSRRDDP